MGELAVRGSVWIALVLYAAGPLAAMLGRKNQRWQRRARWCWTLGCTAFLVHVVSSFHVFYAWSHEVALEETARQVAEVTGAASGAGLYLNYLFSATWTADAIWWWRGLDAYRARPRAIDWSLHGFFFFMVFNATVVFEQGAVRWLGVVITLVLVVAALATLRGRAV